MTGPFDELNGFKLVTQLFQSVPSHAHTVTFVNQKRAAAGRMAVPGPHAAFEMIVALQTEGIALVVPGGETKQLRGLSGGADEAIRELDFSQTRYGDTAAASLEDRGADEPHLMPRGFRRL